ncbi:MAG: hypothetical protein AcusKO_23590 [Acuticoccus sp.]
MVLGFGAACLLLPGWPVWEVALLAAILTPTDAALGQAVVTNLRVPARIREALAIESGLNDGLALPVILFCASLATGDEHASETVCSSLPRSRSASEPLWGSASASSVRWRWRRPRAAILAAMRSRGSPSSR